MVGKEKRIEDHFDIQDEAVEILKDDLVGVKQWKRSKLGYLTGVGPARDSVRGVFSAGKESYGRTKKIFDLVFKQNKDGIAISDDVVGEERRFDEAMRVNGKTDLDVVKSIDNTFKQFWLFFGLTVVSILIGVLQVRSLFMSGQLGLFSLFFMFLPVPMLLALLLRAGFTNWMFRKKRLDSIGAYLASGEILPERRLMKKKGLMVASKGVKSVVRSIIFALMTIPIFMSFDVSPSYAIDDPATLASTITATPKSTEVFIKMMALIVPNVGPIPASAWAGGTTEATKNALGTFAAILLFLGVSVNGYQIIAGLVASAKEGTALGQHYHEVWAPIRVVAGYGFLTPIIGGLCAAQVIVIYLIVWGSNLANTVWGVYVDNLVSDYSITESSTSSTQKSLASQIAAQRGNTIVKAMMEKALCFEYIKAELSNRGLTTSPSSPVSTDELDFSISNTISGLTNSGLNRYVKVDYSLSESGLFGKTFSCGTISAKYNTYTSSGGFVGTNSVVTAQRNTMEQTSATAIRSMVSTIESQASEWAQTYVNSGSSSVKAFDAGGRAYNSDGTPNMTQIQSSVETYANAMVSAASSLVSSSDLSSQLTAAKDTIDSEGWAGAGQFYLTLSRITAAMYGNMNPPFESSSVSDWSSSVNDERIMKVLSGSDGSSGLIASFNSWFSKNFSTVTVASQSVDSRDAASQAAKMVGSADVSFSMFNGTAKSIINWFAGYVDINPYLAMQEMVNLGNTMMYTSEWAYVLGSAAEGIGDWMKANPSAVGGVGGKIAALVSGGITSAIVAALGGMVVGALSVIKTALIIIFAAGVLHAYILPMIPYIYTMFFVVGMMVLVVESLVAAPIWAFMHIRMDGNEFVGQAQHPGYMIVFNLLLRPTLMIFGLILSYLVFGALVFFISHTFMPSVNALNESNALGLIGAAVMITMLGFLHYQAAVRSFNLITQVPDRVARWFGQGGENLGEEHHAHAAAGIFMSRVESQAQIMGARAGNKANMPKPNKNLEGPKKEIEKQTDE